MVMVMLMFPVFFDIFFWFSPLICHSKFLRNLLLELCFMVFGCLLLLFFTDLLFREINSFILPSTDFSFLMLSAITRTAGNYLLRPVPMPRQQLLSRAAQDLLNEQKRGFATGVYVGKVNQMPVDHHLVTNDGFNPKFCIKVSNNGQLIDYTFEQTTLKGWVWCFGLTKTPILSGVKLTYVGKDINGIDRYGKLELALKSDFDFNRSYKPAATEEEIQARLNELKEEALVYAVSNYLVNYFQKNPGAKLVSGSYEKPTVDIKEPVEKILLDFSKEIPEKDKTLNGIFSYLQEKL